MDAQNFDLHKILFEGLTQHGFLFQERCADILKDRESSTHWHLLSKEYPVSTEFKDTRIDFILYDAKKYKDSTNLYSIVECKRVNLEYTYGWLFGRPIDSSFNTPYLISLTGGIPPEGFQISYIRYRQIKPSFSLYVDLIDNWWLEIGKDKRATPQPIEDAFIQLCVGVSGFLQEQEEQYHKAKQPILEPLNANIIPVIITNAPLYYAHYDLNDVDLTSGSIKSDGILFGPKGKPPEKVDWLLVNYGIANKLTPSGLYKEATGTNPADLEDYHKRSIYVVNSQKIIEFFSNFHLE